MKILGIETSCDETAVAVLEVNTDFKKKKGIKPGDLKVLSNIVSSQIKLHAKYGGVVPNLAAREHTKNISHVFKTALKVAKVKDIKKEINLLAVTRGPGLSPALLVGLTFAKTVSWKYNIPIIGVNHLEAHILSNWLKTVGEISNVSPIMNLVVSGGHTELVLMKDFGKYELVGETLDDAVGEAFDKVARLLGLGYPGGPAISKIAVNGDPSHYPLPSPMLNSKNFDFSYSGLKTAVLYLKRDLEIKGKKLTKAQKADIAASFQKSACEVLIKKTIKAAKQFGAKSVFLSGGVSGNVYLRENLGIAAIKEGLKFNKPAPEYTTDNAAMIGVAGYINFLKNKKTPDTWSDVEMDSNLNF